MVVEGNGPTIHSPVFRRRGAGGLRTGGQECPRSFGPGMGHAAEKQKGKR